LMEDINPTTTRLTIPEHWYFCQYAQAGKVLKVDWWPTLKKDCVSVHRFGGSLPTVGAQHSKSMKPIGQVRIVS
jgi:hypothetical protein